MLTITLVIIAVIVVALIAFIATRPDTFRVQRSIRMKARPEKIFPLINDFRRWPEWSPWEKLDPAMKRTQSGTASGKGAVYEWEGNKKVGKGRMEITDTTRRPGSPSNWIFSLRLNPTTRPISRWNPRATPRTSTGSCRVPIS